MWHRLKDLWTHNRYLLLAFVTAISLAGFFGARSISQFIYWADPAHQDQPLAGWMTPRYVGQSYDIPREVVLSVFALDPDAPPRRISLGTLASENGTDLATYQAILDEQVAAWRAENRRRDQ